jgi:hypothetical protein
LISYSMNYFCLFFTVPPHNTQATKILRHWQQNKSPGIFANILEFNIALLSSTAQKYQIGTQEPRWDVNIKDNTKAHTVPFSFSGWTLSFVQEQNKKGTRNPGCLWNQSCSLMAQAASEPGQGMDMWNEVMVRGVASVASSELLPLIGSSLT